MIRLLTTVESISRQAGGMYDAVRRLSQCVAALDVRTSVFSLSDEYSEVDIESWGDIKPHLFASKGPAGYSPTLKSAVLSNMDADLIHVHGLWCYHNAVARKWASSTGKPCIVTPHGMLNERALKFSCLKKVAAGLLFEKAFLDEATCLRALSENEAGSIRAYGLKNPICVVPNGVDLPHEAGVSKKSGNGRKVLLYLGRLHAGKNLEALLKAWAVAVHQTPRLSEEWILKVVGESSNNDAGLSKLVGECELGDSVVLSSAVYGSAKSELYRSASAFVMPSLFEALPNTVLEAWAHGLPVLMTRECSLSEGFGAEAAIECNSDIAGISEGIRNLTSMSDDELSAMGQNGLEFVKKKFSWPEVASSMKIVYDWVLGGGPPPSCVIE